MKLYFIEAICSIPIVGLGQIIKGKSRKGLALLLAFYFFLPALFYFSLLFNNNFPIFALGFTLIFGIILWSYSILDALLKK
ncbi:MAG: hypothetical protein U9R38_06770 [Candidatus Margulisiibacteriota bacterium]|nr:hypothetical protein [Candidatus Margulisiibacteriota bacterium]